MLRQIAERTPDRQDTTMARIFESEGLEPALSREEIAKQFLIYIFDMTDAQTPISSLVYGKDGSILFLDERWIDTLRRLGIRLDRTLGSSSITTLLGDRYEHLRTIGVDLRESNNGKEIRFVKVG